MIKYKYTSKKELKMLKYDNLPKEIEEQIQYDRAHNKDNPFAFCDQNAIRRNNQTHDKASVFRSNFIRDIDKILHCPFYNRYSDKTQVFSLYKNDDITRRSLHVQLVSRIARTIGKALNLNLELIEAIALGHDLGHTPFGHAGEKILDNILKEYANIHFAHNIQSVRILDTIFSYNISLQTLDGIAGHNGEIENKEYIPSNLKTFEEFDQILSQCYVDSNNILRLSPSTLEGCLVRICDIIAYLGKDRQDSEKTKIFNQNDFANNLIGNINAQIINNLSVNIIKNSYGKNYIKLDADYFNDLVVAKKQNYEYIYENQQTKKYLDVVEPMIRQLFEKLNKDLKDSNFSSPIYSHHINFINKNYYEKENEYLNQPDELIVADYIASMTDDYLVELYKHLFPNSNLKIEYIGYFE